MPLSMHRFEGRARIFDSEDEASGALMAGGIEPGTAVVVRGIGPSGDPGMRLLQRSSG